MTQPTDKYAALAALLSVGLTGDQAAYADFLSQITPLLRRMVAGRIAASDVDDVVQEVLISIHKARHTYDGQRPIMPWVVAIARFRMIDHLRKHYAAMQHQTMDISGLEETLPDVTNNTESAESIIVLPKINYSFYRE